jgi:ADP-ribose pyrophosphatase
MARIPDHACRVFKGVLFDVYQWDQPQFDGSVARFEAARRVPSVQILATDPQGRVILLEEEQPFLGRFIAVPGGRVEEGEDPETTVRKELREELGMVPASLELWYEQHYGSVLQWSTFNYVARGCEQVAEPELEPGERITPYRVGYEELFVESERPEFRNRHLADRLFRVRHTPGELERLRVLLFGHPEDSPPAG